MGTGYTLQMLSWALFIRVREENAELTSSVQNGHPSSDKQCGCEMQNAHPSTQCSADDPHPPFPCDSCHHHSPLSSCKREKMYPKNNLGTLFDLLLSFILFSVQHLYLTSYISINNQTNHNWNQNCLNWHLVIQVWPSSSPTSSTTTQFRVFWLYFLKGSMMDLPHLEEWLSWLDKAKMVRNLCLHICQMVWLG